MASSSPLYSEGAMEFSNDSAVAAAQEEEEEEETKEEIPPKYRYNGSPLLMADVLD
jgi:hypothetical protein